MSDSPPRSAAPGLLLVANYDSNVGYAWWLMESFWAKIAREYAGTWNVVLAYPSVSKLPEAISSAPVHPILLDFTDPSVKGILRKLRCLRRYRIQSMYLTDAPSFHWHYWLYRLAGVRVIIGHDHTPGVRGTPPLPVAALKRMIHRIPGLSVDALIAVTPFVSRRHRQVTGMPANRCFIAKNGIRENVDVDVVDVHSRFAIPRSRRVLVSVGRAHHVKGLAVVIEAMALLIHQHNRADVHYLHCGDGPHREELVQLADRLNVGEYVTFAGQQPYVHAILRGCDVAIHSSFAEVGYSLSILECMQAGLPLAVSDNESVCGATEHGVSGLHFETGSAVSAAAAVVSILDSPDRGAQMGREASLRVRNEFTLARTHAQLISAFNAVFSRRQLLSSSY